MRTPTVLVLALAFAPLATAAEPPRFVVDATVSGGDVLLRIDICGYEGDVDVLGMDLGDPENAPLHLRAPTAPRECGVGFAFERVIPEGTLNPPVHCYWLRAALVGTSPNAAEDFACD